MVVGSGGGGAGNVNVALFGNGDSEDVIKMPSYSVRVIPNPI